MTTFDVLTTRLFPKYQGAEAYVVSGIAARCDWVLLSDHTDQRVHLHKNSDTDYPRHVFLSMRGRFAAIGWFEKHILPKLSRPFVLVSGSEDVTVPRQLDQRWRPFDETELESIHRLINHQLLKHWFAENLDEASHERMSPLPLGMVFKNGPPAAGIPVPDIRPLSQRPLRILCAHRIRPGPQWERRKEVSRLARTEWSDWCTSIDEEVSEAEYFDLVQSHAFVICAEGGGLDPSPKAWQTILHGAIPIIRRTPASAAYRPLPVGFVADWNGNALSLDNLKSWHARFSPMHDTPTNRDAVIEKLGIDYWWEQIARAVVR